ncbi:MAG: hypothetical protein ACKV0T_20185 [Planctomycetales bacterium]
MRGPFPSGTFVQDDIPGVPWNRHPNVKYENEIGVCRGQWYRVSASFVDGDGCRHDVGEKWKFLMASLCYHDGEIALRVMIPSGDEYEIPLLIDRYHDRPDLVDAADRLLRYIAPIPDPA